MLNVMRCVNVYARVDLSAPAAPRAWSHPPQHHIIADRISTSYGEKAATTAFSENCTYIYQHTPKNSHHSMFLP